jgi:OOP family OmpA-OmpF porin
MRALVAGLTLLLGVSPVIAAEDEGSGWYLGVGGGQSVFRDVCGYFEAQAWSSSCDDESTGWKVFVGRDIYDYFGLELSFADPGEAKIIGPSTAPGTLEIQPWLASLHGKLEIPLGKRFSILAKAGVTYFKVDYQRTGSYRTLNTGDDGLEPSVGLGVGVTLSRRFAIRAEWENFNDATGGLGQGNVEMGTVSLLYKF